jgi:hypothetical protein
MITPDLWNIQAPTLDLDPMESLDPMRPLAPMEETGTRTHG